MKRNNWNIVVGLVLIVAAAAFYIRDMRREAAREIGAKVIRLCAADPGAISGILVFPDIHGEARNMSVLCPENIKNSIINGLAAAQPSHFPEGEAKGDEYVIFITYTNQSYAIISAARLYESPDDIFVRRRLPREIDKDNKVTKWIYSYPALVSGLGETMNALSADFVPKLREKAPEFNASVSNMIQKVSKTAESEPAEENGGTNTEKTVLHPQDAAAADEKDSGGGSLIQPLAEPAADVSARSADSTNTRAIQIPEIQ